MVANYVEFACLGHVTRARITQIIDLLNLADTQEALLLPENVRQHDAFLIMLCMMQCNESIWRNSAK